MKEPATASRPVDRGAAALRTARGALDRLATGIVDLEAASAAGRAVSPLLVLDFHAALGRVDAALRHANAAPEWADLQSRHAALAPRVHRALAAQDQLLTHATTTAALEADVATMAGRLGLGRIDVRRDADARALTDAHGARGIALGDAIHLHPDHFAPGTADGREVMAHELIHLAQARLPANDSDRDDAEAEAADLAPQLAAGAAISPRHHIDLSRPAADHHGKHARAKSIAKPVAKPGLDAVANAGILLGEATQAWQLIYHQHLANVSADVMSWDLAPQLDDLGRLLWDAKREALSDSTLPESRKQELGPIIDALDALVAQVEALETEIKGDSGTARVMGHAQPAPAKRELKTDQAMSARDAQYYIANTTAIADAIDRGPHAAQLGKAKVVFHASKESFEQAYEDMAVWTDGKGEAQIKKERAEARASANTDDGFYDALREVSHVRTKSAPSTTIHELFHFFTSGPSLDAMGHAMGEGIADFLTRIVCGANGLPFEVAYPLEVKMLDFIAEEIGGDKLIQFALCDATLLPEVLDSKGAGTWKAFRKAFEAGDPLAVVRELDGLSEANDRRLAKAAADAHAETVADQAASEARRKAGRANDPPESEWPVADAARGPIDNHDSGHTPPTITVRAGWKKGVRVGWQASVTLEDGSHVIGVVVDVDRIQARIQLPDAASARDATGEVTLRRPQ